MGKSTYEAVREIALRAAAAGHEVLPDGTELVGRVPHVAPQAWLHILFPPLGERELGMLEERLRRAVPADYARWLGFSNGLYLFSGSLSLDGLRTDYSREVGVWQPFALETPNVDERPADAGDEVFFVGGYGEDGSLLYLDERSGTAHRCSRDSVEPLNSWADFRTMLLDEAERLARLFDERGRRVDPTARTTP